MIDFIEARDIKELANLASEIWHEYWTEILSLEQIDYMVENFQSEQAIKNQIDNYNYTYFYIIKDSVKAGYIGLSKKKDYLFLSKLYIKEEYRHQGLGTMSFGFIKNYAESLNYTRIILTVNKNNKNTINAYNKWGFETINSVVTDIGKGFVMDDYIMEYKLIKH